MDLKLTKKHYQDYLKHHYGEGIFDKIKDFVKTKLIQGHQYIKDKKLISKGLAGIVDSSSNPLVKTGALIGSTIADKLGYGREKYILKPVEVIEKKRGRGKTKLQSGLLP